MPRGVPSAQDTALTTLAKFKAYRASSASPLQTDTTQDTKLSTYVIPYASAWISTTCRRKFLSDTYTNEDYDGYGDDELWLTHWPITAIASIYEDTERDFAASTKLTLTDDYRWYPGEQGQGLVKRIGAVWRDSVQSIRVTYTAGYSTIPALIEFAANRLVDHINSRINLGGAGVQSESAGAGGGTRTLTEARLPADVLALLVRYMRLEAGSTALYPEETK